MKKDKTKLMRTGVQASIILILVIIITLYNLYTREILDFKILGIGDMNPYGGWNALREFITDSSYEFEGISKSMALTIAILAMAVLGGRFFCGWMCPIGALQDFTAWFGSKMKAPKYNGLNSKGFNPLFIKYPILLFILLVSILGYGASIAELSPWRALLNLPMLPSAWTEMKLGFIILAGIFLASIFVSRFFCRYLCPLGAVQTLFSSFSLFSLRLSRGCSHCSRCLDNCPVSIKLSPEDDAITPECIRCMNCVDNCKITTNIGLGVKIGKNNMPVNAYVKLMLLLFFTIWLCVPKLWGGSSIGGNISLGDLKDGVYQGEAKGFAGRIITEVTIRESKITEIKVLDHHESKGWYEEVFMTLPREIIRKQSLQVDGISGATKTSKGLIKSVAKAVGQGDRYVVPLMCFMLL